jgi:lipid II:glycine glycyltransferase (peptidoglycan interpeptide bridge formation enzyme)
MGICMMELHVAEEGYKEKWNNLVLQSPYSTGFHTWEFLKVMEKYSTKSIAGFRQKASLCPLIFSEGGKEIGIMPVFFYASPLLKIAASPPLGVESYFLGPLYINYEKEKSSTRAAKYLELIQTIDRYLKKSARTSIIMIHSCPGIDDARPFIWNGYTVEPRCTSYIPLSGGIESVKQNFSSTVVRVIKKCEAVGLTTREGSEKDLEKIFQALLSKERIHPPLEYLLEIYQKLSKNLKIFVIEKEGLFLSGMVALLHGRRMSFWIGLPKCSFEGTSPNYLLVWSAIQQAQKDGFETFELMGNDDLSLFSFKSKFGGTNIPYYNIKWYSPAIRFGHSLYTSLNPKY